MEEVIAQIVTAERRLVAPLEAQWEVMLSTYDQFTVLVLGTFLLHEFVYFTRYIPFWFCDRIPFFRKYKIQQNVETTPAMISKVLRGLAFSHVFVQVPMMVAFHYAAELIGMSMHAPFPPLYVLGRGFDDETGAIRWTIAMHTIIFLIIEDFWEYWAHRLLHWGPLYKAIHKQHHEFQAPFGIVGEYAHPLEILFLGVGTGLGPIIFARQLHLITLWCYLVARLWQVVDAHSGYDFPWSLRNLFPFWAGADFHDHHHMVFLGNYGTSFRWCDWLFGTDTRYQVWKKEQAKLKAKQA